MSAQGRQPDSGLATKYTTDGLFWTADIPIRRHALGRYRQRLPDDAVPPMRAWKRGEDVQHPTVLDTLGQSATPCRVRVYNHDGEYFAVFIVVDDGRHFDEPYVTTVYNAETHEHPPTQAYVRAHGPHYREDEEGER